MKLNSGGAEDASIQNPFKHKSCIERILINERVQKWGGGKKTMFLARAPTRLLLLLLTRLVRIRDALYMETSRPYLHRRFLTEDRRHKEHELRLGAYE